MKRKVVLFILVIAFIMSMSTVGAGAEYRKSAAKSIPGNFLSFISDPRWCDGTPWNGAQLPKLSNARDWGCAAYCADFTRYCFGIDCPNDGEAFYDANEIRAGDVICIGDPSIGDSHWFICLERDGKYLYTADANVFYDDDYRVRVGWYYTIKNSDHFSGNRRTLWAAFHFIPLTYTVEYDANGGENAPAAQTKAGGKGLILSSNEPTRASTIDGSCTVTLNSNGGFPSFAPLTADIRSSYSFTGWNTEADGSGVSYAPGDCYCDDADLTLYAQWNSSTAIDAVRLPTPVREGWDFLGWAEKMDAEEGVTGSYTPGADVTLYALWEPLQYTVQYHANGGRNAPAAQIKNAGEALTLSSVRPTRASTSLGSYTVKLDANGGMIRNTDQTVRRADVGVTFFSVPSASRSVSELVKITSLTAQRRNEFTFIGWNTAANGSGANYEPGALYETDADLTLYAQWSSRDTVLPVTLPTAERKGFVFLGWAEKKDAEKGMTGSYTPSGNVTLYALWGYDKIEVKYDANGGEKAPEAQYAKPGEALYLSKEEPTHDAPVDGSIIVKLDVNGGKCEMDHVVAQHRKGFTFICWNTAANGSGEKFAPGDIFKSKESVTLYAQWVSAPVVDTIELPTPVRDGWVFLGWAESPEAASGVFGYYQPKGETALYAIWGDEGKGAEAGFDIQVNYDANGGEKAPAPQTVKPGEELYLSKEVPTHDSTVEGNIIVNLDANGGECEEEYVTARRWKVFVFTGWNTAPDGSGEKYAPGDPIKSEKPVTLYAQWSCCYVVDPIELPTPEFEGWSFRGWAESPDDEICVPEDYRPSEDTTLYALWE